MNGARITLAVAIQNVGQTPANGVFVSPAFFLPSPKKQDVNEERKQMCERSRVTTKIGQTVFPGEPGVYHITITAPYPDMEDSRRAIFGDKADEINMLGPMMIIVVVAYGTAIDREAFYYTAATYTLSRLELNAPGTYALKTGETIPQEQLLLHLFPLSGIVAE